MKRASCEKRFPTISLPAKMMRLILIAAVLSAMPVSADSGYEVVRDWPALPEGKSLGLCAGVGIDSHNHVLVFHRNGRAWTNPFPAEPIAEPTVSLIDGGTGKLLAS